MARRRVSSPRRPSRSGITDPEAQTTGYQVDGLSRLRFVTRPGSEETEYRYDLRGRLDVTMNARGQKLDYDYETWGPLAQVEHFSSESDPDADRAIVYGYDLSGNLLTVEDSAIAGTPASPGLVYEAVSPDAGDPYDALNRLRELEIHLPGLDTRRLGYSYDRFGNRFGLIFFDGSEIFAHGYVYGDPAIDARDRLQKAILPGMTESDPYVFAYLENDDLETVTRPSGVETALAYLDHGPIDTITTTDASMAALDLLDTSSRDGVDRILALVETFGGSGKTWAFEYDRAGQLTDATYPSGLGLPSTPEAFEYDLAGNRETPGDSTAYEYSANDELEKSPFDAVLCYDADGNLTSKRSAGDCTSGTVSETLTWDAVNRLTQWSDVTETVSFVYDAFGRRVKKTSSTGGTTWYVWDSDQLLAEIDESTDARTVRYAYALGFAPAQVAFSGGQCADSVDNDGDGDTDYPDDTNCASASAALEGPAPAADQCDDSLDNDGDGLTDFAASGGDPDCTDPSDSSEAPLERIYDVHTDHLDTPRLLTDAEERVVWRAFPEAFGQAMVNEDPDGDGQDVSFQVRFPGHYFDAESGLHYNWFRYYAPEIGRYISADPIGQFGGDANVFTYAFNSPLFWFDPLGLASLTTTISPDETSTTTFDPRPEDPDGSPFSIETRNNVTRDSLPGAAGDFSTDDVSVVPTTNNPRAYGPDGTYIETGDPRGRDIHGGGSCLDDSQAPRQGWCPTQGCTRGQNEDIKALADRIKDFQSRHPGVAIPYTRTRTGGKESETGGKE